MNVFLTNFPLFNHALFILILADDFLNFVEIINWVFVIEAFIFGFENRVVEEVFENLLKFM